MKKSSALQRCVFRLFFWENLRLKNFVLRSTDLLVTLGQARLGYVMSSYLTLCYSLDV